MVKIEVRVGRRELCGGALGVSTGDVDVIVYMTCFEAAKQKV